MPALLFTHIARGGGGVVAQHYSRLQTRRMPRIPAPLLPLALALCPHAGHWREMPLCRYDPLTGAAAPHKQVIIGGEQDLPQSRSERDRS